MAPMSAYPTSVTTSPTYAWTASLAWMVRNQYRVWEKGKLIDEPYDIKKYWNEDLTTFVLGCSMSFELPLIESGIPIQHIENNTIVPMYKTSIDCEPAGQFSGKLVVSMRPLNSKDTIRSIQILFLQTFYKILDVL